MIYDKDIREPLFDLLEEKYGKSRIFEEKNIGASRADAVMVTENALYGIEIKSDADTYARLERQVRDYDLYYDYNYVVVGSSHGHHIAEHVPTHWGIITVEAVDGDGDILEGESSNKSSSKLDFYTMREPKVNPNMDWHRKIEILWRMELAHIQELNGLYAYKSKSKAYVANYIVEAVDVEVLSKQFCDELFERDYDTIAERINEYRQANGSKPRKRRKYKRRKTKKNK